MSPIPQAKLDEGWLYGWVRAAAGIHDMVNQIRANENYRLIDTGRVYSAVALRQVN